MLEKATNILFFSSNRQKLNKMKTIKLFLALTIFFLTSCKKNETDTIDGLTDGVCIVVNDKVELTHNEINYYDTLTHKIYLKNDNTFLRDSILSETFSETFTVYADMELIYSGYALSTSSLLSPLVPVIYLNSDLRDKNTISIKLAQIFDMRGTIVPDPRNDEEIIEAFKKYDQLNE